MIAGFGELLVRLTASANEPLEALLPFSPYVGGAEANVLAGLSKLGHKTRFISKVTDNALGEGALMALRAVGVDTSRVVRAKGRMGLYFLSPGAMMRPAEIIYDRQGSVFAQHDGTDFDWKETLQGADWLHISGVTAALGPKVYESALKAMRTARALGIKVAYDGNYRPKLWAEWESETHTKSSAMIEALMNEADLLFANHKDIGLVSEQTIEGEGFEREIKAAELAFARFPNLSRMASTSRTPLSADDNRLSAQSFLRTGHTQSQSVDLMGIVDRIGGGDAFCVGLYDALFRGLSEKDIVNTALAVAALKHAQKGDLCAVSREQIEGVLGNEGFDVRR